jgi:hypothetical protein
MQRQWIEPTIWEATPQEPSYAVTHPYVRRFWTAVIGPGAVADLLRLATAARRGRSLRVPTHLDVLVTVGLVVAVDAMAPAVVDRIPPVPPQLRTRLTPALRREHAAHVSGTGVIVR